MLIVREIVWPNVLDAGFGFNFPIFCTINPICRNPCKKIMKLKYIKVLE